MSKEIIAARSLASNLNFATAQKIINRLLTCERISKGLDEGKTGGVSSRNRPGIKMASFTKQELARKLGITQ